MRSLIRVVWQAIMPGIMHTVISDVPARENLAEAVAFFFSFFVFLSDELLKIFNLCICCVSLFPCQRNNLLAAPVAHVKGEGEESQAF